MHASRSLFGRFRTQYGPLNPPEERRFSAPSREYRTKENHVRGTGASNVIAGIRAEDEYSSKCHVDTAQHCRAEYQQRGIAWPSAEPSCGPVHIAVALTVENARSVIIIGSGTYKRVAIAR